MSTDHYKDTVIKIINAHMPHAVIYLFGSRARNDHKTGADIDIALDAGFSIPLLTMSVIEEALEESTIPVTVDLVDVHAVDQNFLNEIKSDWIIWQTPKKTQP